MSIGAMLMQTCEKYPLYVPPDDYRATWVVGGGKGGTVKTTSAIHLGIVLARSGRTLVVDADAGSQSSAKWAATYRELTGDEPPFTVVQHTIETGLASTSRSLRRDGGFKHLIIDLPGNAGTQFGQALRVDPEVGGSVELILAITPSRIEVVTINGTLEKAGEVADETEREIGAQVVWCRNDTRTSELAEAVTAADDPELQWPYLRTVVPQRRRYRNFGEFPEHTGAYEGVASEIIEDKAVVLGKRGDAA
ncbi:hypothetical protein [Nocardia sp. CNY236]|uniref:nucleotide-binding protein n=1 Tax=Nocardia sp. CNY236 TaxID=1169152 RepID=UPI0009DD9566|nr:hypothetical protein [Nocardia sp. CNY236]